jgi:glutamyl-tRNA reductase
MHCQCSKYCRNVNLSLHFLDSIAQSLPVPILTLGISHHSAALDLRERLAVGAEQLADTLSGWRKALCKTEAPGELALISTCNRTEVYWHARQLDCQSARQGLLNQVAQLGKLDSQTLAAHTYERTDLDAARHVFRVASGLDSMVLGETQILGQLKTAVRAAQQAGTLGTTLNQLFDRSFAVAKQVRSTTAVGTQSVSLAAAGVKLAQRVFGDFAGLNVLFIGAGEMIQTAMAHFAAQQPESLTIANRTQLRAAALLDEHAAQFLPLAQVGDQLRQFDIVVTCTASSLPILGLGAVKRAIKSRRNRPLVIIDLAVPRDVEPEAAKLENVYLYCVDDLAQLVNVGRQARQAAVAQAEGIVDQGVASFKDWLALREHAPLAGQLSSHIEALRQGEFERARRALRAGRDPEQVLEQLSKGMTAKLLHGAYAGLRSNLETDRQLTERAIDQFWLHRVQG